MNKLVLVLRWLVALPGGLLAALLATFPLHWAVLLVAAHFQGEESFLQFDPGTFPAEPLERLGYAFVVPLTLIYTVARIVPAYKVQVAGLLVPLWSMTIGAVFALALSGYSTGSFRLFVPGGGLYLSALIVLHLSGAITGLYAIYRRERGRA